MIRVSLSDTTKSFENKNDGKLNFVSKIKY